MYTGDLLVNWGQAFVYWIRGILCIYMHYFEVHVVRGALCTL